MAGFRDDIREEVEAIENLILYSYDLESLALKEIQTASSRALCTVKELQRVVDEITARLRVLDPTWEPVRERDE